MLCGTEGSSPSQLKNPVLAQLMHQSASGCFLVCRNTLFCCLDDVEMDCVCELNDVRLM